MAYVSCEKCKTLFVSPRPAEEYVTAFYRDSDSAIFWRQKILKSTRDVRKNKLFRPRVQWLLDVMDEHLSEAKRALVVGYHNDLLVEELIAQRSGLSSIVVTNPIADIEFAEVDLQGIEILPTPLSELAEVGQADLFLAFDILDRCSQVDLLFSSAYKALGEGGLLLATTTLGSGFDIQVLWDRAPSIYPPDRMNLFSAEGIATLADRHGFEILEFSTPGVFDVEEVQHAIQDDPGGDWPRFVRYLIEQRDDDARNAFQEFLQRFRLSSFARIVMKKKPEREDR
jgi:hypothetical protein